MLPMNKLTIVLMQATEARMHLYKWINAALDICIGESLFGSTIFNTIALKTSYYNIFNLNYIQGYVNAKYN